MSRKILIVDDSEHDRHAHQRALRQTGATFTTAPTVADGVTAAGELRPDLILLDYNLPDGSGLDFIAALKAQLPEQAPPIVMLTGSGDENIAVAAMKAGASDYLIKDVAGGHLKLLPMVAERALREHADRLARYEAERQLQLAANVYHNITEGIVATEPDGTIVSVNPAFCTMSGYAASELIGAKPNLLRSHRHPDDFFQAMWAAISSDGRWQGDVWNRRKDGSLLLVRETITAIRDDRGRLQNYMAVLVDITEARQTEEFIRHQAYHDSLTDLPNRSLFMDRLRHQLAYAGRQKTNFAVLFVDLDGFKAVNDELGHDAGDDLLKEAAARLKGCVRESDTVARLGGDEFTAILNDIESPDAAARVADKIINRLGQPVSLRSGARCVSASIGIATYPNNGDSAGTLLNAADAAMYQAKRAGKAAYALAAPR